MGEKYDFVKQLPSGGFGHLTVFFDKQLNREVVVKTLREPNIGENRNRLRWEARCLYHLRKHEHVVDFIGYNPDPGNPCIVMEHCRHGTLQGWLDNRGFWAVPNWWDVACAVQHAALGLQAVHTLGGFHRDVKPSNLLVGDNKAGQRTVKLGDFGMGRLPYPFTTSNITRHGCGTDGYIAPELYEGREFDKPCDIYSLGITGVELLTGSKNRELLHQKTWVPADFRALLLRMTNRNPAERPDAAATASAISVILEAHQADVNKGLLIAGVALAVGLLIKAG
jgi:serine/threonine-protein kinase